MSSQPVATSQRCVWAPLVHDAPAAVVLRRAERPCGHEGGDEVPTCAEHLERVRATGMVAPRATQCGECGEVSAVVLVGGPTWAHLVLDANGGRRGVSDAVAVSRMLLRDAREPLAIIHGAAWDARTLAGRRWIQTYGMERPSRARYKVQPDPLRPQALLVVECLVLPYRECP